MSPSLPLFVYGTLMSGQPQSGLLQGLARQRAKIRGTLFDLPAGYPALQLGGDGLVHGELVAAAPLAVMTLLDTYEGVHEGLYRREIADVLLGLRAERAWVYVMDRPDAKGGRSIPSGRWRRSRRR